MKAWLLVDVDSFKPTDKGNLVFRYYRGDVSVLLSYAHAADFRAVVYESMTAPPPALPEPPCPTPPPVMVDGHEVTRESAGRYVWRGISQHRGDWKTSADEGSLLAKDIFSGILELERRAALEEKK